MTVEVITIGKLEKNGFQELLSKEKENSMIKWAGGHFLQLGSLSQEMWEFRMSD